MIRSAMTCVFAAVLAVCASGVIVASWATGASPGAAADVQGQCEGVGPSTILDPASSGRVASIAVDPTKGTHWLVVGGGGVLHTWTAGAYWAPLTDSRPTPAPGALALDARNT